MADLYGRLPDDMFPNEVTLKGLLSDGDQAAPEQTVIDERRIKEAAGILEKYKAGKANLEERIVKDELWYELRHWEVMRSREKDPKARVEPTSAWLFNSIMNKHADAMDNFPEPVVLPRERSDEESAKTLSSVIPVVMETNDFEATYSDNWWEKLKHGTGIYGIFWNPEKENGLGDVDIREIDLLNIFWEPGIRDIQDSRNLFIVELIDEDLLKQQYPDVQGKLTGSVIDVKKYIYDDSVDTSDKALVVDWYYKVRIGSREVLQYCKFVGSTVLFASENDPQYRERGWYDHGQYPVVFDVLFPEKGTPVGFGYVSICKDPQLYIDKLYGNILQSALMGTRKRFWVSSSTGVNEEEFADWENQIVHVEGGDLTDARIREMEVAPPSPVYYNILQQKIDEMKETSSNRDVNNGSGSGVTAAAAIAALQEAGNKTSRDMISASYRSYRRILSMVLEVIRQFYDLGRSFRITGTMPGQYEFVQVSNASIKPQPNGEASDGTTLFRKPIFDLKIKAQKKNPFSRMEENERAKELYGMGFFNPERAQEALNALEMMDFEGIEKVKEQVNQGQTLANVVKQLQQQLQMMQAQMAAMTGVNLPGRQQAAPAPRPSGQRPPAREEMTGSRGLSERVMDARTPMTSYGQRLAERSKPDMSAGTQTPLAK